MTPRLHHYKDFSRLMHMHSFASKHFQAHHLVAGANGQSALNVHSIRP